MWDTRKSLTGLAATAAVTAAAALAGCGGGPSGDQSGDAPSTADNSTAVRQVMSDLQTASRTGDGERICAQIFTPKLADSVTESAAGGSCAKEVKSKLFSPEAEIAVQHVDVPNAANATATIKEANGNTSTVFLVKQSGRWRIRSVQPA